MIKYLFIFISCTTLFAQQNNDWQTYYEKSGFLKTPSYDLTIDYCKKLADGSDWIHYTTFGESPQNRDLPLLIIDNKGNFTAEKVRATDHLVLMIQAGIHSGEIDGKDAGFMLFRDMVIKNIDKHLLDNVTVLFIPIFNVDGHERSGPYNRINQNGPAEMGWRTTAQNYNLNRDYLKADSPEMQALLKLYNTWLPGFFIDCHVTNGADYQYTMTYMIDLYESQHNILVDWIKNNYLPQITTQMNKNGFPIIEYVQFRKWHDPGSGLESSVSKPRYSTGYTTIQNRLGLLLETHMLKPYKERVESTYQMIRETMKILNTEYADIKSRIKKVDTFTSSEGFRNKPYPLTFKLTNDSTFIDFLGYKYTIETSDLSGGDWFRYSKDTSTFQIPLFNSFTVEHSRVLPEAYIIPPEWAHLVKKMEWHGIRYSVLKKPHMVKVKSYKFSNEKWADKPYENHHTVTFDLEEIEQEKLFPAGSCLIPMNQRTARVIAHILEPEGPDSYVSWGYFDPVFERKEYAENYVMEEYARIMLSNDEKIKEEFEKKKKEDQVFANDPALILDWFYQKSPYWDKNLYIYPVGKIFDKKVLNRLEM